MPYIKEVERIPYKEPIKEIAANVPTDSKVRLGHMNYIISYLISKVYGENLRYSDINDIQGFLECVSKEFYRKKAADYEDLKEAENGAV